MPDLIVVPQAAVAERQRPLNDDVLPRPQNRDYIIWLAVF